MLHRYTANPTAFPVLASLYPPLLGSGIRIRHVSPDWTSGELTMRDGQVLYFSRSKKREAVETITAFLGGSI